jgi:small GTP-binding protein
MPGELESLKDTAERLAALGRGHEAIAARASRIAERLRAGAFHVAVLGEFKRGKSTLVNALLGRAVLPTGVVPLTAVATEVHHGPPGVRIVHDDGGQRLVGLDEVGEYVTEPTNPGNRRRVARAEVSVDVELLEPGLVLVDTPGTASVYAHNTQAAKDAFADADGAIVVLSVDSPVTADEKRLLESLSERGTRTFVVVNKVDHLSEGEMGEVRRFVEHQLSDVLGDKATVHFVSARQALEVALAGGRPEEAGGFAEFSAAFRAFVDEDLLDARITSARQELARLGAELRDAVTVEAAATELTVEELRDRAEQFSAAAARERQALAEDQVLLDHAVAKLGAELADRLAEHARHALARFLPVLEAKAAALSRRHLEDGLQEEVERCVRQGFEELRRAEAERAEQVWQQIASDFRRRTQVRVDAVRRAAADLFDVPLPDVTVPAVAEERERFFYLFVHVEGLGSGMARTLRLLAPSAVVRRRALKQAADRLAQEFDKHVGRARWDLTQRLDQVRLRFEAAMRSEVERAEQGILEAAMAAQDLLGRTQAEQQERRAARASLLELGAQAQHLGTGSKTGD